MDMQAKKLRKYGEKKNHVVIRKTEGNEERRIIRIQNKL